MPGLNNTQKPVFVSTNPYNRANYQPAVPAAQPYVPKANPDRNTPITMFA